MNETVLEHANQVLNAMERGIGFERSQNGRLWIVTRYGRKAAVLNSSGNCLGCNYGQLGMGGTQATAMAQLVRWVRGQTRYPLRTWRYWSSISVQCFPSPVVELLDARGYETPEACGCVLCAAYPIKSLDWWNLDGVVGPCCSFGECWSRQESSE